MGALRPGGQHPGTADLPRRRGRPSEPDSRRAAVAASLAEQLQHANEQIADLRAANARLRQAAEADRKRAEIAEACAKRLFALVAQR